MLPESQTRRRGNIRVASESGTPHDSVSVAEVLVETLKDGDEARLDAWASERHRVARNVVAMTDRMTRMATMKSATGKVLRNIAVAFAGHLPPVRAALAKTLAELDAR